MDQSVNRNTAMFALFATLFLAIIGGGQVQVSTIPTSSLFSALWEQSLPITAHYLIALPAVVAAIVLLWKRSVLPTVKPKMMIAMHSLMAFIAMSFVISDYKWTTLLSVFEWVAYFAVFWVTLFCVGRRSGPVWVMAMLAIAGAVLASYGILEYGSMRSVAPSWRVFATWVNPNALAGILTLCFFPALALTVSLKRSEAVLAGVASTLILFSIFLTGSKGGLLACAVGLAVFGLCTLLWAGWKRTATLVVPLLFVGMLTFALRASTPANQGSVVSRVQQASANEAQSSDFRKLLWKSAVELAKKNEVGTGLNTFQFVGSKPGLTPPTHFAHSTYLQLLAECGPITLLLFAAVLFIWAVDVLRGARALPVEQNILRAGAIAAVSASLLHNQIDSLLYHFGIGVVFFALLAVALLLAADGTVPEVMRAPGRKISAVGASLVLVLAWGYAALGEQKKSAALGLAQAGAPKDEAQAAILASRDFCPMDGEGWYVSATLLMSETSPDRINELQQAVRWAPTVRNYRMLGRTYAAQGDASKAKVAYDIALKLDPSNLSAWIQLVQMFAKFGDRDRALGTAQQMIDLEKSPAIQVRAIPELIPTEIAEARVFLADNMTDSDRRKDLYRSAVETYLSYLDKTLPQVKQIGDDMMGFAGETLRAAKAKMAQATSASEKLAALCQRLGDAEGATFATTARERFAGAGVD
jgi:tetratricopeptide (TPR) repeat protein